MLVIDKLVIKNELTELLRNELPVLRARLGLSRGKIAELIGISRQSYNTIETGKREMTWSTFMSLLGVFQSNEQTLQMLSQLNEFESKLKFVLDLDE